MADIRKRKRDIQRQSSLSTEGFDFVSTRNCKRRKENCSLDSVEHDISSKRSLFGEKSTKVTPLARTVSRRLSRYFRPKQRKAQQNSFEESLYSAATTIRDPSYFSSEINTDFLQMSAKSDRRSSFNNDSGDSDSEYSGFTSSFEATQRLHEQVNQEIKIRDGTIKLLAVATKTEQSLEASRNLLLSNAKIMRCMERIRAVQKRKRTTERSSENMGSMTVSDLRIPLMWKDSDHFKNKGDHRRYSVFCLLKVGSEVRCTTLLSEVDRTMTDLTFDDVIEFTNVPENFEMTLELYCHKLSEDLSIASTPIKIKKKLAGIPASVGRKLGKSAAVNISAAFIGEVTCGPKFELVAHSCVSSTTNDIDIGTYDLKISNGDGHKCELPLFSNYCCTLAYKPHLFI